MFYIDFINLFQLISKQTSIKCTLTAQELKQFKRISRDLQVYNVS